jgi:hypothetical protein
MTGNAGAPTGVGQTARNRRVTTPLQAAMTARTNLSVLSGGHHVRTVGLPIGVGQSGGCLAGMVANPNFDPSAPATSPNGNSCMSAVTGLTDAACSQGQMVDLVTGQCANICPDGSRPANGCPPETGLKLWWDAAPTWQKAAAVGGGVVAVGGLGWLLFHKKSPVHKALKRHVR